MTQTPTHAFESFRIEHHEAARRFARRLTSTNEDAEDLLQETYLKVFRNIDAVSDVTSARAWLFQILRRTAIDRRRQAKCRPLETSFEQALDINPSLEPVDPARDPEKQLLSEAFEPDYESALLLLSEDHLTVLRHVIDGNGGEQGVPKAGVTPRAFRKAVGRARKAFVDALREVQGLALVHRATEVAA